MKSVLAAGCALLLLGGALRTGALVTHRPLLGYANNYDFVKISSTVGMWVDEPSADRFAGHASSPYAHYKFHQQKIKSIRYLSSELIFVYASMAVAEVGNLLSGRPRGSMDLRVIGCTKLALFLAVAMFLTTLFFRRSPWLGLASAAVYAVVICDPFVTLYFNTLYFDDSAVFFTWLSIGCALLLLREGQSLLLPLFTVSLFLAGLSKMQHPGLPLALVAGFAIALGPGRRGGKKVWLPLGAAVVSLVLGALNNQAQSMQGMQQAAATDTWFATVLPALSDPPGRLRAAGVPARCASYVGKTWYDPGMQPAPCPEIFKLGRARAVMYLLSEPKALWKVLAHAVALSRPRLEPYGQVESVSGASIESLPEAKLFTLTSWTSRMPVPEFCALVLLCLAAGFVCLVLLWMGKGKGGFAAAACVFLNAGFTATFVASLLGDGYIDLARHEHLGAVALLTLIGVLPFALLDAAGAFRRRLPTAAAATAR
jgi:hypothetical protein